MLSATKMFQCSASCSHNLAQAEVLLERRLASAETALPKLRQAGNNHLYDNCHCLMGRNQTSYKKNLHQRPLHIAR